MTPSFVLNGKTPHKHIIGHKQKYGMLKIFGCFAYSSVLNNSDKFSPYVVECVLFNILRIRKLM